MLAQADSKHLQEKKITKKDRAALVALQALIQSQLAAIDGNTVDIAPNQDDHQDHVSPHPVTVEVRETVPRTEGNEDVAMRGS